MTGKVVIHARYMEIQFRNSRFSVIETLLNVKSCDLVSKENPKTQQLGGLLAKETKSVLEGNNSTSMPILAPAITFGTS